MFSQVGCWDEEPAAAGGTDLRLLDDQPALGAGLQVLAAQRLPQTDLHLQPAARGLPAVHHLHTHTKRVHGGFKGSSLQVLDT